MSRISSSLMLQSVVHIVTIMLRGLTDILVADTNKGTETGVSASNRLSGTELKTKEQIK